MLQYFFMHSPAGSIPDRNLAFRHKLKNLSSIFDANDLFLFLLLLVADTEPRMLLTPKNAVP
jgi:hypothetical protein